MRIYVADHVPFLDEELKKIAADTIEEALQYNIEMWEESGKERPFSIGVLCTETGETLSEAICNVTGYKLEIRGKAKDLSREETWRETGRSPNLGLYGIMPTPGSSEMERILARSLEDALEICLGLWEGETEKPTEIRTLSADTMETLDYVDGHRQYGKMYEKNGDYRWKAKRFGRRRNG